MAVSRTGRPATVTRRVARSMARSPSANCPGAPWRLSATPTRATSSAGENGLTM